VSKQTILFFDIDLTLVSNRFSGRLLDKLLHEMLESSGKTLDELADELGAENTRRQQDDPDNLLTMDWDDMVQQLARQYGVTLSDTVDRLWLEYAATDGVDVLDNAPQVLEKLKAEHRQLIIATKGLSKYQDSVLAAAGLTAHFNDILTPDKTGYLKTSPGFFNKYRSHDAIFIHIGDHYYDDVICAKRNGFYSVMRAPLDALAAYDPFERAKILEQHFSEIATYPAEGTEIRPDAVIISLEELPEVVSQIEANHKTDKP
jgi:putative hydrolase of the HAD superfamily